MGSVVAGAGVNPADQRWGFWPLLPLYPYGRRRTLFSELIPGQLWSLEQLTEQRAAAAIGVKRQQRPETPALIRRIHTSSSHHTPHRCSDSAEEWIKPASNHPLRPRTAPLARLPPTHQHQRSIPQMRQCSRRRPPSNGGVRTNNLTQVSINNQTACKRKGSNSAAIGGLGVTVFRRQMQQI